jgi:transcriptional regulator with XRE-family HTH domain
VTLPSAITPPPTITTRLGDFLRELRRIADASQREMAERTGLSSTTVARLESDESRDIRLSTLERLAREAGCCVVIAGPDGTPIGLERDPEARDLGGRHLPAHLDPLPWTFPSWWFKEPHGPHTFTLDRFARDYRRAELAGTLTPEMIQEWDARAFARASRAVQRGLERWSEQEDQEDQEPGLSEHADKDEVDP